MDDVGWDQRVGISPFDVDDTGPKVWEIGVGAWELGQEKGRIWDGMKGKGRGRSGKRIGPRWKKVQHLGTRQGSERGTHKRTNVQGPGGTREEVKRIEVWGERLGAEPMVGGWKRGWGQGQIYYCLEGEGETDKQTNTN